ncbi:unnamed protein product [Prunus brigantina]
MFCWRHSFTSSLKTHMSFCSYRGNLVMFQSEKEKKKQLSKEDKKALQEEKLKQEEKYMWAIVDGVKEKVISSFLIAFSPVT